MAKLRGGNLTGGKVAAPPVTWIAFRSNAASAVSKWVAKPHPADLTLTSHTFPKSFFGGMGAETSLDFAARLAQVKWSNLAKTDLDMMTILMIAIAVIATLIVAGVLLIEGTYRVHAGNSLSEATSLFGTS